MPTISVVIPSFNSPFIREAVDSVLSQTFEDFEVIVVDCSTDTTCLRALDHLAHPKIKVFRRSEQHLPGDNRNFGVDRAAGEFIVCVDADDIIEPTFLEEGLFVLCCVTYSLVGTSVRMFGLFEKTAKLRPHPTADQIKKGDSSFVTWLMRKDLWLRLGGQIDSGLGPDHVPEDWDFLLRATASGATLYNRGSYGCRYRKHYNSITAHPNLMDFAVAYERMERRYPQLFDDPDAIKEPPAPALIKDGWKRLLTGHPRREAGLLLLPEQINDAFIDNLRHSLGAPAPLVVLSTCQMETYPAEFQTFLSERGAEMFSLPDFLEEKSLWLEFINYLSASRKIATIWYGQNGFFLENFSTVSEAFPDASFNYISRYTAPGSVSGAQEISPDRDSLVLRT